MIVLERDESNAKEEQTIFIDELEKEMANLTLCSLGNSEFKANHTIRILGYHRNRKLSILIDTGSSSNFMNDRVAKGLHYQLVQVEPVTVTLTNGVKLRSDLKVAGFK